MKLRVTDPVLIYASFWEKVDTATSPEGCWDWKQSITNDGFGQAFVMGERLKAHRAAMMLELGVNPEDIEGFFITHICGNNRCCRPEHLCLSDPVVHKRSNSHKNIPRRFWSKVDMASTPYGCWEWMAARSKSGYGKFRLPTADMWAHRMAWELTYGPIPGDQIICHKCDNPACCRPDHLFIGTHQDNATDRENKGRGRYLIGEQNGGSKVTEHDVAAIRKYRTIPNELWAIELGVSAKSVKLIRDGKTWKHLTEEDEESLL